MLIPLPVQFVEYIQNDSDFGQRLLEALDQPSPISIRINPGKQDAKIGRAHVCTPVTQ